MNSFVHFAVIEGFAIPLDQPWCNLKMRQMGSWCRNVTCVILICTVTIFDGGFCVEMLSVLALTFMVIHSSARHTKDFWNFRHADLQSLKSSNSYHVFMNTNWIQYVIYYFLCYILFMNTIYYILFTIIVNQNDQIEFYFSVFNMNFSVCFKNKIHMVFLVVVLWFIW